METLERVVEEDLSICVRRFACLPNRSNLHARSGPPFASYASCATSSTDAGHDVSCAHAGWLPAGTQRSWANCWATGKISRRGQSVGATRWGRPHRWHRPDARLAGAHPPRRAHCKFPPCHWASSRTPIFAIGDFTWRSFHDAADQPLEAVIRFDFPIAQVDP
jgi:hypothetical protein